MFYERQGTWCIRLISTFTRAAMGRRKMFYERQGTWGIRLRITTTRAPRTEESSSIGGAHYLKSCIQDGRWVKRPTSIKVLRSPHFVSCRPTQTIFRPLSDNFHTTFRQLSISQPTFRQLSDNFLSRSPISDNFQTTFRQLSDNFQTTFYLAAHRRKGAIVLYYQYTRL